MIKPISKRGAMEMSVGTIVTIVLVVTVMVMGLVLIRSIFRSGTDAVESIDASIQNEITKLFADEEQDLIIYPPSGNIDIDKGDDPAGFAFSVKNAEGAESQSYNYIVSTQEVPANCGSLTETESDSFIIGSSGEFTLSGGETLGNARLVRFSVPESAPSCSLFYQLQITGDKNQNEQAQIFVTIK